MELDLAHEYSLSADELETMYDIGRFRIIRGGGFVPAKIQRTRR
jgi:hypothetical protein